MHEFKVWAPLPRKVELQIGRDTIPMERRSNGWWSARVESARVGTEYGYLLDSSGPFPDPRSEWQPGGVHGLSQVVDHDFKWTDGRWQAPPLAAAVIYELHLGTFTPEGTFAGAIERLPELATLGLTHIEVMPVAEFPGRWGWGYDGVDLFAPKHLYGGSEGLKRFVDTCHAHDLAVILDVVYNHLGPSGNHLDRFGPYFNRRVITPWGAAINLDGPDSDEVRRFLCDNALMWLRDYHVDGLRLDAVHALCDGSAVTFLEQLAGEVKSLSAHLGRHLLLIAESDLNDPRLLWPSERGGFGLDAQWSDDFHHALHAVLAREHNGYYSDFGSLAQIGKALEMGYVFDGQHSDYRRRKHGRPVEKLSGHRFLAYLQNHDQIGNRALGERNSGLMSVGRLKIGAAVVFTSPFVPMLFQGEEWGASSPFLYFTDYDEPRLAEGVREGRSREFAAFGWDAALLPDPQSAETFERSKLHWHERTQQPHAELLEWHRQLIQLRREEPVLRDGRRDWIRTKSSDEEGWLLIERGPISVACNLGENARPIALRAGKHHVLLSSHPLGGDVCNAVELPPDAVVILKLAEAVAEVERE